MKIFARLAVLLTVGGVCAAQDLVINNARIIDGTGTVIEQGSLIVTNGRIASVSAGNVSVTSASIDANGMTVMPGLIDTHRHDLFFYRRRTSDAEVEAAIENEMPGSFQTLLAEGFTTVMTTGFYLVSVDIRERLEAGELVGPRLLTTGPVFTAPGDHGSSNICRGRPYCIEHASRQVVDPEIAREKVRELAAAGVDGIKAVYDSVNVPEVRLDDSVLAAIIDEATKMGLPALVHAETVDDMMRVVELGARRLVHTPYVGLIADSSGAQMLREAGVPITTTVSYSSPQFAEATDQEQPTAWHEALLQNIRHLWDEGVVVAFGTDSPRNIRPIVEIQELSRVLTPAEVIAALTRNAAIYLDIDDEIGTLQPGKIADIVILDGDPLTDSANLARVAVVIKGGQILVDNR